VGPGSYRVDQGGAGAGVALGGHLRGNCNIGGRFAVPALGYLPLRATWDSDRARAAALGPCRPQPSAFVAYAGVAHLGALLQFLSRGQCYAPGKFAWAFCKY
jgi:hypothetical protein